MRSVVFPPADALEHEPIARARRKAEKAASANLTGRKGSPGVMLRVSRFRRLACVYPVRKHFSSSLQQSRVTTAPLARVRLTPYLRCKRSTVDRYPPISRPHRATPPRS